MAGWLSGQAMKGRGFLVGVLFKVPNAVNGFNLTSILVAFLGAVVLMVVVRMFQGRGGRSWLHR